MFAAIALSSETVIRRALGLLCLGVAMAVAGCDKDSSSTPGDGGVQQITGNERIGWQQAAATREDLDTYRYNIYVDNVASELQGVSCNAAASGGFVCSGRLPPMTSGRHTLEISAFVNGNPGAESPRSTPLTVNVVQSSTSGRAIAPTTIVTSEGIRLAVISLGAGLDDPSDLAVAADGRIFISERSGRIRVFRDGMVRPASAPGVVSDDRRGVLAVALDPEFAKTGYLYAAYAGAAGFRLVRYRVVGDTLGEGATLLDGIEAATAPSATLRFGPDRKLYLGLDDAGDPSRPGDLGSFNGKVLRLNADGTTPPDQAGGTPVYALNVNQPRGMDWDGATLWIAESLRLQGVVDGPASSRRGSAIVNYRLPAGVDPEGATFYRGSLIPALVGDLLVASADLGSILRLRFDPGNRRRIVSSEYLLQRADVPVQAIAEGPNGVVYFCTLNELFMIVPEPAAPAPAPRIPM
jgi:glucose/arabinose dehydrogenase